jgi:hypothetical protein
MTPYPPVLVIEGGRQVAGLSALLGARVGRGHAARMRDGGIRTDEWNSSFIPPGRGRLKVKSLHRGS